MRAVGYVRQSRESEAGASPEAQRRSIEQYAAAQGWTLIDVLADIGRSGFDPRVRRPALDEVLDLAARHGVERVIVWKLDRLTRRGIREALALIERIEDSGAALVSVTEPFDTSTELGKAFLGMMFALARTESEKISERVRGSKAIVRESGGWNGGPVPFGFTVERVVNGSGREQSRLAKNGDTAAVLESIVRDVLRGESVGSIVKRLREADVPPPRGRRWNQSTVFGLLRNPVLAGWLPDGKGGVLLNKNGRPEEHGDAFVTADGWRKLQSLVEPRKGRRPQERTLLGGVIYCASCGGTMGGDGKSRSPSYRCTRPECEAPARVPMHATEDAVLRMLLTVLDNDLFESARGRGARTRALDRLARWWAMRSGGPDIGALMRERDDVRAQLARLREMNLAGDFADDPAQYRKLHDLLTARLVDLTDRLDVRGLRLPTLEETRDLDADELRDLIKLLLRVECVKADRPGIKFKPEERLRISLLSDPTEAAERIEWSAVLALADS